MVIDRITDGTRIAQLLASELDGREDGGLEAVSVVDADRDVEPTVAGARAYDVVVSAGVDEDERPGADHEENDDDTERLAQVFVHPDRARLTLEVDPELLEAGAADVGLEVVAESDDASGADLGPSVLVDSGAAVKRATDVVQAILSASDVNR